MKKKYLKLTSEQKARGVIFSSQLMPSETIHEVKRSDDNWSETIERLLDDEFFNGSPFKHNLIRR